MDRDHFLALKKAGQMLNILPMLHKAIDDVLNEITSNTA